MGKYILAWDTDFKELRKTEEMMKSKLKILIFLMGILILMPKVFGAEKIGYVNMEKVFNEYEKTKVEENKLTKKGQTKQKEIDSMLKEINKMREDMKLLNEEQKKKKREELDKKMTELRDYDRKARADLLRERDKIIRQILKEINEVIKEYGKNNGYKFIINSRALIYKDDRYDLTDEIIKILNKRYRGASK